jgi:hypothetical protein
MGWKNDELERVYIANGWSGMKEVRDTYTASRINNADFQLFRKASELQIIENLLAPTEEKACVEAKLRPVTRDRKQSGMRKKDTIRGKFESGWEEDGLLLRNGTEDRQPRQA